MTDSTGKAARLEEERFHDLVHSVNSDGLQGMAWPGRRKSKAEQSDRDKAPKETGANVKGSIGQDKGIDCKCQNTKEKHSKASAKGDKADKNRNQSKK